MPTGYADQGWFWTPEWQAKEREVDEALEAGDYSEFTDIEELLASLHGVKEQRF